MNIITLKDYAKQNKVSYEAVRKQVARYANELGDHIIKDGRQQFLDEEAVTFLDSKRQKNPVVIIQQDKDEQIEALKLRIEQLLLDKESLSDKVAALSEWKAENAVAIAEANQRQLLLEDKTKEIASLTQKNALLSDDIEKLGQKVGKLEKTSEDAKFELSKANQDNHLLKNNLKRERRKNEAQEKYIAEVNEYLSKSKLAQLFTKRPVMPNLEEETTVVEESKE